MKGQAIPYSQAELDWIEARKDWVISDLHRAFCEAFGRTDATVVNLHSLRKRKGWKTGRTGCFAKGMTPANKGRKMPFNPNSARTQFRKGQLPANTKWLGHERVSKDGYVEISVAETNPHTGYERRYVHKHRWLWEQANGPIPADHCLKCLGDKKNTDPSNWELIPRGLLPRLNGRSGRNYDAAAPEIKPTILAIAKLEHRVRTRRTA